MQRFVGDIRCQPFVGERRRAAAMPNIQRRRHHVEIEQSVEIGITQSRAVEQHGARRRTALRELGCKRDDTRLEFPIQFGRDPYLPLGDGDHGVSNSTFGAIYSSTIASAPGATTSPSMLKSGIASCREKVCPSE